MTEVNDPAPIKAVASHAADQSLELSRTLMEEHSASFRWLMASLLTINAAGLLGLKDFQRVNFAHAAGMGLSFFLGLCCALFIAFLGQKSIQRMMGPVNELGLYWRIVSITGQLDEEKQAELTQRVDQAAKFGKWPRWFGLASLIFFGIGLAGSFCATLTE